MRAMLHAAVLSLVGCSWIFVDAPPSRPDPGKYVVCSESRLAPVLDSAIAVTGAAIAGLGVVAFAIDAAVESGPDEDGWGVVIGSGMMGIGLVVGLPLYYAARYGFRQTSRCRRLHSRHGDAAGGAAPRAEPGTGSVGSRCGEETGMPNTTDCEKGLLCRNYVCISP